MDNKSFEAEAAGGLAESSIDAENGTLSGVAYASDAKSRSVSKPPATAPYAGMGKEDLLRFSQTPFWRRLRMACLVFFWLAWLALLTTVVTLTVVLPRCKQAPELPWWKTNSFYQVYIRSFYDSDADGVGDLKGLTSKLDHLESLHTNALVVSSFYRGQADERDFGYEITDHMDIDPAYGTMEDFDHLLETAHKKDIKVIVDFVPNYTGLKHPWFTSSSADFNTTNPYWNYYVWTPCRWDTLPNNWLSVYGASAWTYSVDRGQCYLHQFTEAQPELNMRSDAVQAELEAILRFWLDKGVDGFRVNVPAYLYEDSDLRDEELVQGCTDPNAYNCQDHSRTRNLPAVYDLIHRWRQIVDQYSKDGDRVLLTDAHENVTVTADYYGMYGARGAHLPMNYQLRQITAGCGGECVRDLLNDWTDAIPDPTTSTWVLNSQDLSRLESSLGRDRTLLTTVLAFTLPGTPLVYYGEEIGMVDGDMDGRASIDPAGDVDLTESRDKYRTPMQWTSGNFSGFMNMAENSSSSASPWLPVNEDYVNINVQDEEQDYSSPLSMFKALSDMRRTEPAIYVGDYWPSLVNSNVFSFVREFNGVDSFLIASNFGHSNTTDNYADSLAQIPDKADVYFSLSKNPSLMVGNSVDLKQVTLAPGEGAIFVWEYTR